MYARQTIEKKEKEEVTAAMTTRLVHRCLELVGAQVAAQARPSPLYKI